MFFGQKGSFPRKTRYSKVLGEKNAKKGKFKSFSRKNDVIHGKCWETIKAIFCEKEENFWSERKFLRKKSYNW